MRDKCRSAQVARLALALSAAIAGLAIANGPTIAFQLAQGFVPSARPAPSAPPAQPAPSGRGSSNPAPTFAVPTPSVPAPPNVAAPAPPVPAVAAPASPAVAVPTTSIVQTAPARPFSLTESGSGFVVGNLQFSLGSVAYTILRAEVRGTPLGKDELARLLDPSSGMVLAERINGLRATEIVIPELVSEMSGPQGRQTATYRDIRLADLASGRLRSAVAASGSFAGPAGPGRAEGTFGAVEITDADLGLAVALMDEKAAEGQSEMKKIYGAFSIDAVTSRDAKGAGMRIARLAGRDLLARRTKDGWAAMMTRFAGSNDLNKASPQERSRVLGAVAEMLDAFEIGSLEATGIEFRDPDQKEASGRVARVAYAGALGRPSEFRIEGLEAGRDEGRVRIASFSLGGLSLSPALRAATEMAGASPGDLGPGDWRRLVPALGSVRLSGVEIEPGDRSGAIAVGAVELLADKPVEAIPTDLRFAVRNVMLPIGPDPQDDTLKQMKDLGYARVEGSLAASLAWNEAGQELVLRDLSIDGVEMGSVTLHAVLGNVSRDVFSPDEALASVALVSASAKSVEVAVRNGGLFERILARDAKQKGQSVDDLRREYGMAAAIGVPIILGNSSAAKTLGQAMARFVAKPGRLLISARAKDSTGLGIADLAGSPDPSSILEKMDVTAAAE